MHFDSHRVPSERRAENYRYLHYDNIYLYKMALRAYWPDILLKCNTNVTEAHTFSGLTVTALVISSFILMVYHLATRAWMRATECTGQRKSHKMPMVMQQDPERVQNYPI